MTHPRPRTHVDDLLVDTAWLAEHLEEVLIVDCRFGGDRDTSLAAYRAGHVPGAVHSYWLDLCDVDTSVMTLLPAPARAVAALSALGVGPHTLVVAYADTANLYAARLWHLLRVHGHPAVRLLDGGLEDWTHAGGALETGDVAARPTPCLDPAAETVTYCQGGVRAAHTALALESAGFDRVRVYDGSWAQWGNDPTLPIVTPADARAVGLG